MNKEQYIKLSILIATFIVAGIFLSNFINWKTSWLLSLVAFCFGITILSIIELYLRIQHNISIKIDKVLLGMSEFMLEKERDIIRKEMEIEKNTGISNIKREHTQDYPVWLLNLEESKDRRIFMEQQLKHLGIKYEIIKAVDGKKISNEDSERYFSKNHILYPGEMGCALSHARLLEKIVEENHEKVLILEDDVILNRDLFFMISLKNFFPKDWELINFMANRGRKQILPDSPSVMGYKVCSFLDQANRTSCFLINKKGAKRLLKKAFPVRLYADELTGNTNLTGLISYGTVPNIVRLASFKSDIWSKGWWPKSNEIKNK